MAKPRELTKEFVEARVRELGAQQPWNHNIELSFGIETHPKAKNLRHGKSLGKWQRLQPYLQTIDLAGKRILDVGCNEGYFSLKCCELGAKEVLGIDINCHRIKKACFVKEVLNLENVIFDQRSLYDLQVESLGRFDVALFLGVLHRLPDPYVALQTLVKRADLIVIEWAAFEDPWDRPLLLYDPQKLVKDPDNNAYFFPTVTWVQTVLREFDFIHQFIDDRSLWNRAIVIGSRHDHPFFQQQHVRHQIPLAKLLFKHTLQYLSIIKRAFSRQTKEIRRILHHE